MPKFNIRVTMTETIQTSELIPVNAPTYEAAVSQVRKMIDDGEVYDNGDWEEISANADIVVDERK